MENGAAAQIIVTGRVQGVGFRWSLARIADDHGVRGWVRNRPDGAVEALLQGPRARLDDVIAWMRQGPPGASVADVHVEMVTGSDQFERFEIRG
jgi:acylphosphatase